MYYKQCTMMDTSLIVAQTNTQRFEIMSILKQASMKT